MRIHHIYFILGLCIFISSCKKKEDESAPHVTTIAPNSIGSFTATSGGMSIDNGPVTDKGVCWSNDRIPDINDAKASGGSGEGNFSAVMTGLEPNMTYYVRAYATNKYRTGYGNVLMFTTHVGPTLPSLITYAPSSVTQTSANCSALLQTITNTTISSIGFCWSTHAKPTTKDNFKTVTTALIPLAGLSFSAAISGLQANTTYYLRSFAINADGTSYGTQVTLKTTYGTVTDYNGNVYGTILIGGQEWMAENLRVNRFNDGTSIPYINDNTTWSNLSTPGYCNFNNSSTTSPIYGKLYNWYCVTSTKNIAPAGWHVATSSDWSNLQTALGDSALIKMKLSGTQYWSYGNGTNQSGFSAAGSGYCDYNQYFYGETISANYWIKGSATMGMQLGYSSYYLYNQYFDYNSGLSIRCVKD